MNPRYPVYIISKGRHENPLTARALDEIGVPFQMVIESQEFNEYAKTVGADRLLPMPFPDMGQGSIPARNFVWEHSIRGGHERHWILDDNIRGFQRLNRNLKIRVTSGTVFRCCEDFVDRYTNVKMAGMHYVHLTYRRYKLAPIYLNNRCYSCILLSNDLEHRWRGRYNEDTDLSLRILKDGFVTVLFNAFLADKQATMVMKGGNSDELYKGDGRRRMAESLKEQHPDVVKIMRRWNRWQHYVDYGPFKENRLERRTDIVIPDGINEYGMKLVRIKAGGGAK